MNAGLAFKYNELARLRRSRELEENWSLTSKSHGAINGENTYLTPTF